MITKKIGFRWLFVRERTVFEMTRKERLQKKEKEAKDTLKEVQKELRRIEKAEEQKAKREAEAKEQARAMEFYRKYKDKVEGMDIALDFYCEYRKFIDWMQGKKIWKDEADGNTLLTRYEFCRRQMEKEQGG